MSTGDARGRKWKLGHGRTLSLDRARLMGIVNTTPDSFSDGGRFLSPETAVQHALALVEEGADIIDVGGESTRPGAGRVSAVEQIRRTIPVITGIRRHVDIPISIDTTLVEVAHAAIGAGADAVNDVSAGREDADMFDFVARQSCGIILMHRHVPPGDDRYSDEYEDAPVYRDVLEEVYLFCCERAARAASAGIDTGAIILDPGFGFGKTVDQNYELMRGIDRFLSGPHGVLCGVSRKSFIAAVGGSPDPGQREAGTLAAATALYLSGVRLFRVHEVATHRDALAVAAALSGENRTRVHAGGGSPAIGEV